MFSCDQSSWWAFSQAIFRWPELPDLAPLNPGYCAARQLINLSRSALACFFRKRTALRKAHIGLISGMLR